jgi:hypothetical protein
MAVGNFAAFSVRLKTCRTALISRASPTSLQKTRPLSRHAEPARILASSWRVRCSPSWPTSASESGSVRLLLAVFGSVRYQSPALRQTSATRYRAVQLRAVVEEQRILGPRHALPRRGPGRSRLKRNGLTKALCSPGKPRTSTLAEAIGQCSKAILLLRLQLLKEKPR